MTTKPNQPPQWEQSLDTVIQNLMRFQGTQTLIADIAPMVGVLWGAALVSAQMRVQHRFGQELGEAYQPLPFNFVITILLVSIVIAEIIRGYRRSRANTPSRWFKSGLLAIALPTIVGLTNMLESNFSGLQSIYFLVFGSLLVLLIVVLPPQLSSASHNRNIFYFLNELWDKRALITILIRYNVLSRYSQAWLGILWIILIPLSTSLILAFIFSTIFRAFPIGDVSFVAFFLSALTFYAAFNQGLSASTGSISDLSGLINQVYFPREVLIFVKLGEALVDLSFGFASMLLINAVVGVLPNPNYIYLPFLVLIQMTMTLGLMFFIGYLSVIIKDIPQLVGVLLQLLFYSVPILYPIYILPESLSFFVLINPLANLIDAYREIILYNRPPQILMLYYPTVVALIIGYLGYKFFKQNEKNLADYV